MRIHDVSQPLESSTAVYPGDPEYHLEWVHRVERGDPASVARLTLGDHFGTHADGPLHIREGEPPIGAIPLEAYLGRAVVVDAVGTPSPLGPELLDGVSLERTPRVLFRSRKQVDATTFPHGFAAIAPELARRLVAGGAKLVGTDAPSVDPEGAERLETHGILMGGGVAILESLVLTDVEPGEYTLVALPLKLMEADSSPVRAVLIEEQGGGRQEAE